MIAQVIVDIEAKQTDRIFEYHIPDKLNVEIGSRVYVPFGPRKLQGFVVGKSEKSDFKGKLKDLLLVVDEMPPLTKELVDLSAEMARDIYSYRISILKTMLPRVMRANYRKILRPITDKAKALSIFKADFIDLDTVKDVADIILIKELLKDDQAKIEYLIENRAKEKTENEYELVKSKDEYLKLAQKIRKNALQQKKLLEDIIHDYENYPKKQSTLEHTLEISSATLNAAVKKDWLKKKQVEVYRNPLAGFDDHQTKDITLNAEQKAAYQKVAHSIDQQEALTYLLEGVTGSGKTEVYLHAMSQAISEGRNALMLVPEISLTPQMVRQVKARFGNQVAVLHSGLSEGELYDEWRRIRRGEVRVVVGARSAVFAPLKILV